MDRKDSTSRLFERLLAAKRARAKDVERIRRALTKTLDREIAALRKKQRIVGKVWARRDEIRKEKVSFLKMFIRNNIWGNIKFFVSSPFIYMMIIPALAMHAMIETYQQVAFRIYRIPLVNPKEHFIYERKHLQHLNWFEKLNCIYCSYFNCLASYVMEIAGRTERFWCPLKYSASPKNKHSQYDLFIDEADDKELRKRWDELRKFESEKL